MGRYERGYLPKIEYWTHEAFAAKILGDEKRFLMAKEKIAYFTKRHKEVYGNIY